MASLVVRPRSLWMAGPVCDLALIIASPLLVLAGISAARLWRTGEEITAFVVIWAIGHHLPGMMRAYGDRALFARFSVRFVVAPVLLLALCVSTSLAHLSAVALITGVWGWWHYLMQTYGFARIYDAKAGSVDRRTCRLDQAMCLAWFAAPVVLAPNGLLNYLNLFYKCGGPILPAESIQAARFLAVAAAALITPAFLINAVWQWRSGRPPSPVKLLLMGTTFAGFWYSLATASNILVSYALFELFHDVQYLTIVWLFNRRRAETDPQVGGFTRFLFRERGPFVLLYALLVFAYGMLNYVTKQAATGELRDALLGVFAASTLLHYYYDGFIWKLRESETSRPLGIEAAAAPRRRGLPTWVPHAALWSSFALIVGGLVLGERQAGPFSLDRHEAIAAALPDSVFAHQNFGMALASAGRHDEAIAEYRKAVALNPYVGDPHYLLGAALLATDERAAMDEFREALRRMPDHAPSHYNLAVALHRQGRLRDAEQHYRSAGKLSRSSVAADACHALALLLAGRGKIDEAIRAELDALRQRPDFSAAHQGLAWFYFQQRKWQEAARHCRAALSIEPASAEMQTLLAQALERVPLSQP